ncbi:MAG: hypothetical protein HW421_4120 [Ignavibacteria bacterium]|nr:hypothetical protein [Ignavibacteria bacterium]
MSNEPKHIFHILSEVVEGIGMKDDLVKVRLESIWTELYSDSIARSSKVKNFKDGCLTIESSSSTWRAEIRLRREKIMDEINEKYGSQIVKKMVIK